MKTIRIFCKFFVSTFLLFMCGILFYLFFLFLTKSGSIDNENSSGMLLFCLFVFGFIMILLLSLVLALEEIKKLIYTLKS